jgi:hypothetical protein
MSYLIIKGWAFIIIGAVLIGIGGVTTTLGWNYLSTKSKIVDILRAVRHEIEINETYLKDPLFVSNDESLLASRRLYPRFKSSSLTVLLTSGQFNASRKTDRGLLRATADYESSVLDINARLDVSDNLVILKAKPDVVLEHRKLVRESSALKGMISQQNALKEFIAENYPSVKAKHFLDKP